MGKSEDSKEKHWHSYNVLSMMIAFAGVLFGGLKWYSEAKQVQNATELRQQLDDANRRYEQLVNDQRDEQMRNNVSFQSTISVWELKCKSQAEALNDDERTIKYLREGLALSQLGMLRTNANNKMVDLQDNTVPAGTPEAASAVNPLIGKWRGSFMGMPMQMDFSADDTVTETVSGMPVKFRYVMKGQNQFELDLNVPLTGETKTIYMYNLDGNTLRMKADQFMAVWLTFTRATE